jgi:hypothetical protein
MKSDVATMRQEEQLTARGKLKQLAADAKQQEEERFP